MNERLHNKYDDNYIIRANILELKVTPLGTTTLTLSAADILELKVTTLGMTILTLST